MKKSITVLQLLCALIMAAYIPAFANGGPSNGASLIVGGNISFVNVPDIFVERENLDIKISPYSTLVTAVYTLKNDGPAREIGYIFPVTNYLFSMYKNASIERIAFYDGKTKLEYSVVQSDEDRDTSGENDITLNADPAFGKALKEQHIYYNGIVNNYYSTKLRFAKSEIKTLTVTYKSDNSYTGWSTSKSPLGTYSDAVFLYDLRPAASWGNGKAAEFNLRIDYTELKAARSININIGDFQRDNSGIFTYSAKDFSFTDAGIFSITADYPFEYLISDRRYNWLKRVYASSTLPGKNGRYSVKNLFDDNIDTVWASNGNAVGAVIEFAINDADIYESTPHLKILNGFVRNEKLYYANSRIKKLKVETWYHDEYQVEEIEVEDIPYEQIYKDVPLMNAIRIPLKSDFVRLTILDVYPGKKDEEVCISEIYWAGHTGSGYEVSDKPFIDDIISQP